MDKRLLFLLGVLLCAPGCQEDNQVPPPRSEYIKVYESSPKKTVDNIQIPLDGVTGGKIHIISNVDLEWRQVVNPDADMSWFKITDVSPVESGHLVVTYNATSLLALNSLDRRSSRLSFSCPSAYLGKFLPVQQGYDNKFYEEFDDEPGQYLTVSNRQAFTTDEYSQLGKDYFDYISFNAWAESENDFPTRNITLDITVSGALFYETGLATYRINVPLGAAANKSNLQYLLIKGDGDRISDKAKFTFSTANDDLVYVHIDNFAAYTVTESELGYLYDDEDLDISEDIDWL